MLPPPHPFLFSFPWINFIFLWKCNSAGSHDPVNCKRSPQDGDWGQAVNKIKTGSHTLTIIAFRPANRPWRTRTTFPGFMNFPMVADLKRDSNSDHTYYYHTSDNVCIAKTFQTTGNYTGAHLSIQTIVVHYYTTVVHSSTRTSSSRLHFKMCCFYSFKNVQDWLYVEHYLLQQTMRSMLFSVTQNNNSSLGSTHESCGSHLVIN